MDKKYYELITRTLKNSKPSKYVPREIAVYERILDYLYPVKLSAWENYVIKFSLELEIDNPSFNKTKFLQDCGYNQNES